MSGRGLLVLSRACISTGKKKTLLLMNLLKRKTPQMIVNKKVATARGTTPQRNKDILFTVFGRRVFGLLAQIYWTHIQGDLLTLLTFSLETYRVVVGVCSVQWGNCLDCLGSSFTGHHSSEASNKLQQRGRDVSQLNSTLALATASGVFL